MSCLALFEEEGVFSPHLIFRIEEAFLKILFGGSSSGLPLMSH